MKKLLVATAIAGLSLATSATAFADGTFTVEAGPTGKGNIVTNEKFSRVWYDVKSPRDATTGLAVGRRVHQPVCIARPSAASSPALLQALWTNTTLKSATFENANGMRYKLTNASLASFTLNDKDEEIICFTFQKIDVSFRNGPPVSDNWAATTMN
jgi:type VI secretion system Hcp family effector